jgi:hypothetical protein
LQNQINQPGFVEALDRMLAINSFHKITTYFPPMFEFLFQSLAELVLQIILEFLAELGIRSVSAPFDRPPNPWLASLGYAIFGAAVGALSVWAFPSYFVVSPHLRLVNLIVTPFLAGLAMCAIGAWRARRGEALIRLDKFAYGYLFAVALALIRFTCAA